MQRVALFYHFVRPLIADVSRIYKKYKAWKSLTFILFVMRVEGKVMELARWRSYSPLFGEGKAGEANNEAERL